MKALALMLACAAMLAAGCGKKPQGGGPPPKPPAPAPPQPVTTRSSEPPPAPEAVIQDAQRRFKNELALIRKHSWKKNPTQAELDACLAIFTTIQDGKRSPAAAVRFIDMNENQVRALIGNPKDKKTAADGSVAWIYGYPCLNGALTASLTLKDGRVASYACVYPP